VAVGTVLYHFAVVDSTNACAAKLLSQIRLKPGTIVLTDHQTAGRGQIGRDWHSAPGLNLCLSCVLYPEIHPRQQFQISMAVALAVRETVAAICGESAVYIKWPNDVYVGDLKIAGILIQNAIQGNGITSSIAGIGINVNEVDFPGHLPNPTSLRMERYRSAMMEIPADSQELEINAVLDTLVGNLTTRTLQIGRDGSKLFDAYQEVLYRRNVPSRFRLSNETETLEGRILRVNMQGQLVIQWLNGTLAKFQRREIEFML